MNLTDAVKRAIEEPTLVDALTWICIWENDRAVKQALGNPGSGSNGASWDTCFKISIDAVMNAWLGKSLDSKEEYMRKEVFDGKAITPNS
jgi:hypothetical protein